MTSELSTLSGKRKYLIPEEQERFLKAASQLHRAEVRTFCMVLVYTGCRISEALELTADRIDLTAKTITFRTLKQREKIRFRAIPAPDDVINALELVHHLRKTQKAKGGGKTALLWPFRRSMASRHVATVMEAAGIEGVHASAKGLRHGFGVRMAQRTRNPRLVQNLLGHTTLETTAIYMDLVGDEARAEVLGAW